VIHPHLAVPDAETTTSCGQRPRSRARAGSPTGGRGVGRKTTRASPPHHHTTRRTEPPGRAEKGSRPMAMAPEQVGIGIRRLFTEPGEHPYDSVEWEQREARIQNYKDGTDAFFQPDVEFPVAWSQNSTNIVAQ